VPFHLSDEFTTIMRNFRGKGKIYDSKMTYLSEVVYDIYDKYPAGNSGAKWRGEITPDNGIMPMGNHIIELDDGRRGPCIIKINTYSSFGLVVDSFDVEGTGPLVIPKKQDK
jgi:hypothetical protein